MPADEWFEPAPRGRDESIPGGGQRRSLRECEMSNENLEATKSTSGDCLDQHQIVALVAGQLSPSEIERMLGHITVCKTCCDKAEEAGLDAAGVSALKRRAEEMAADEVADPKPSDRPTTEHPAPEHGTHTDHPAATSQSAASQRATDGYACLSAPRLPDEIGRLGPYRVLKILGQGGMGIVYEAEDPHLDRRVALKVLRPEGLDTLGRERFMQEARLAASLHSDRIVTIYQIGEDHGCPYLVMELLKGESLDTYLHRRGKLSVTEALRIARDVAEGLAVAHDKALVHRDIKPANIWLESGAPGAPSDRLKLLDFGIARSLKGNLNLTMEGRIIGTPSYMCPEQANGESLDGRSDLFSLGCVLYAMLVGQSPFERANSMLSIRAVADADVPPLREKLPNSPKAVLALLKRLLSKDPANRPANARQVVDEIRSLEMNLPGTYADAGAVPSIVGMAPTSRRRRMGWGSWVGFATLIVAGIVGLAVQYQQFVANTGDRGPGQSDERHAGFQSEQTPASPPAAVVPLAKLPPIKVGILHSLTGPMSASERSLVDAFTFAIDEINARGGLLGGRLIEPIIRDGKSYDSVFAQQALELITQEKVVTLFGVWRSSCRKSVEEVCQGHDHLLVYPTAYEGLEESPYVVYMGGCANQQITPGIKWAYAFLGKRKFFLVGTEGMYSRGAHEIIKDEVAALGATIVGDEFQPLADTNFGDLSKQILASQADMIVNSVVGVGNINLFSCLRQAGIRPDKVPVLSLNVTEEELRTMAPRGEDIAGNYAAWSYFQSLKTRSNEEFIARFRKRFGSTRVINDPMVSAYCGMHLWALAVQSARSDRVADIRREIVLQKFDGPDGPITIDPKTLIARRMALIGEVNKDLEFDVVWTSPRPVEPVPYPSSRSRKAWDEFVLSVRQRYGGHWRPEAESKAEPTKLSP
jgi:urea transport system substrate-binding protein